MMLSVIIPSCFTLCIIIRSCHAECLSGEGRNSECRYPDGLGVVADALKVTAPMLLRLLLLSLLR
jgi:hypothetical protein